MRIAIGSDHAGFDLKETVKSFLLDERCDVIDLGTHGRQPVDDTEYATAVASAVREHNADRGIVICGSGVGASIAANRVPGVRAGLCHDTYSAHQGVEHDDMNVLVLGGHVVGAALARELVVAFLEARFSGEERHLHRLAKLTALENPVRAIGMFGQSVWLDGLDRGLVATGELARLVAEDGLSGVTSNLSILDKAISTSADYRELLEAPDARALEPKALYERIVIRDVQDAADELRETHEETARRDGYVSLDVSPRLAHDTAATLDEGRRLWRAVARENLMIKIPATPHGIAAIEPLIGDGVNVHVTLLFTRDAYEQAAEAYVRGVERLLARGGDPNRVASVASFFVSRIDTAFATLIEERLASATSAKQRALLQSLSGKVAIANAKLTYDCYREIVTSARWDVLAARGAHPQRLMWASTGAKNPSYRDVVYVEELIGRHTVTTVPTATLDAFRDHGRPRASLIEDVDDARDTMATVEEVGISFDEVGAQLLAEGVRLLERAFDKLLGAVERQTRDAWARRFNGVSFALPAPMSAEVKSALEEWQAQGNTRRLWHRDPTVWTGRDEGQWLGWLGLTNGQLAHVERFARIAEAARTGGFAHVVLLGMGGSSLGALVLRRVLGAAPGFPELIVLDSTDPAQVRAVEARIDLARTLFVVSSKSGATLEPNIFERYFYERVAGTVGHEVAGRQFVAITDPGSKLQHIAEAERFRRVFLGRHDVGGRYSVLSDFGLVPAAATGVDVPELLDRTEAMVWACMPTAPARDNPGVSLGVALGVAATRFGRDKVTFLASGKLASFGAWLEQLIAESTGKDGKGLIPIDREPLVAIEAYGADRVFVHLALASEPDPALERFTTSAEAAGHPVVRVTVDQPYDVGQELFRWELATAAACALLRVNPFDQPDVEASKAATRRLSESYELDGALPSEQPMFAWDGVRLFADAAYARELERGLPASPSLVGYLAAHLARLRAGDYFALLAYVAVSDAHEAILQSIRAEVLRARHVATCLEFGPRLLHSTGQLHKGGPNSGVFLQITCDDAVDVPVPGTKSTFGAVKAAQARGDFQVLGQLGRRALRVHLTHDVPVGLRILHEAIGEAVRA